MTVRQIVQKHPALSKLRWIANTYVTTLEGRSLIPCTWSLRSQGTHCGRMDVDGATFVSVLVCLVS